MKHKESAKENEERMKRDIKASLLMDMELNKLEFLSEILRAGDVDISVNEMGIEKLGLVYLLQGIQKGIEDAWNSLKWNSLDKGE